MSWSPTAATAARRTAEEISLLHLPGKQPPQVRFSARPSPSARDQTAPTGGPGLFATAQHSEAGQSRVSSPPFTRSCTPATGGPGLFATAQHSEAGQSRVSSPPFTRSCTPAGKPGAPATALAARRAGEEVSPLHLPGKQPPQVRFSARPSPSARDQTAPKTGPLPAAGEILPGGRILPGRDQDSAHTGTPAQPAARFVFPAP